MTKAVSSDTSSFGYMTPFGLEQKLSVWFYCPYQLPSLRGSCASDCVSAYKTNTVPLSKLRRVMGNHRLGAYELCKETRRNKHNMRLLLLLYRSYYFTHAYGTSLFLV